MNEKNENTKKISVSGLIFKYSLIIELVIIFVLFGALTKGTFLSTRNLSNLMMQGVTCSTIAITMTLVIVSCNSDLSAGTALGCIGTIAAVIECKLNWGAIPSLMAVMIACLLLGLWHGYWIAYRKLPAFIVTLATQLVLKGVILAIGNGASIGPVSDAFAQFGSAYLPNIGEGSIHITSLILTVIACLFYIVHTIQDERRKIKQGLTEAKWKKTVLTMFLTMVIVFAVARIFINYKGYPYAIIILVGLAALFHYIVNNTCLLYTSPSPRD